MGSVPRDGTRTLITFSIRRSTAIAIAVSLLVHLLALLWVVHKVLNPGEGAPSRQGPLVARLQPRAAPAQPATPAAQPEPPAAITPPQPAPPRVPQPRRNPAITQSRPAPRSAPPAVFPPPPQAPPDNNPNTDMMADLRNRQAQREASDGAPGTAGSAPPGENGTERALRNFNSLTKPGISGIFTITHMGTREGEFTFNGWTGSPRNSKRESFSVDAGLNGNLERAMVREMIKLIRRHYSGDFNFESQYLGRIQILSARPQDNAELEEFLLREFFGKRR